MRFSALLMLALAAVALMGAMPMAAARPVPEVRGESAPNCTAPTWGLGFRV